MEHPALLRASLSQAQKAFHLTVFALSPACREQTDTWLFADERNPGSSHEQNVSFPKRAEKWCLLTQLACQVEKESVAIGRSVGIDYGWVAFLNNA
jgi:hypothetical protein